VADLATKLAEFLRQRLDSFWLDNEPVDIDMLTLEILKFIEENK
jgi:hypothetical protein